jgi:hypothetical protein
MIEPIDFADPSEQKLLDRVKRLPQIENAVEAYRTGLLHLDDLERATMMSYGNELPQPVAQTHLLFGHRNALTDFAGAFSKVNDTSAAIVEGLQRYRDDPTLPDPCLLAFSDQQYQLLYTAFTFGWVYDEPHPDLKQLFRFKGMKYLGKIACTSSDLDAETDAQSPQKVWRKIRKRGPLADLRTAAASDNKARLGKDVIHYLSIVHKATAAGALDSTSATNNNLAKYASAIVGDLIDELT